MSTFTWRSADDPPDGQPNLWTRPVIAVTNAGNAYRLAYSWGEHGTGVWQRPAAFESGEKVVKWCELPGVDSDHAIESKSTAWIETEPDAGDDNCDAAFLFELEELLRHVPAHFGTDQYHCDRLHEIANAIDRIDAFKAKRKGQPQ